MNRLRGSTQFTKKALDNRAAIKLTFTDRQMIAGQMRIAEMAKKEREDAALRRRLRKTQKKVSNILKQTNNSGEKFKRRPQIDLKQYRPICEREEKRKFPEKKKAHLTPKHRQIKTEPMSLSSCVIHHQTYIHCSRCNNSRDTDCTFNTSTVAINNIKAETIDDIKEHIKAEQSQYKPDYEPTALLYPYKLDPDEAECKGAPVAVKLEPYWKEEKPY